MRRGRRGGINIFIGGIAASLRDLCRDVAFPHIKKIGCARHSHDILRITQACACAKKNNSYRSSCYSVERIN